MEVAAGAAALLVAKWLSLSMAMRNEIRLSLHILIYYHR